MGNSNFLPFQFSIPYFSPAALLLEANFNMIIRAQGDHEIDKQVTAVLSDGESVGWC